MLLASKICGDGSRRLWRKSRNGGSDNPVVQSLLLQTKTTEKSSTEFCGDGGVEVCKWWW